MALIDAQVKEFWDCGVLIVENLFDEADILPVQEEITAFIGAQAEALKAEGKLEDLCEDEPFEHRAWKLHQQCPAVLSGIDIMQMKGPETFKFLRNPDLMEALTGLIGPEISCNPIQHLRAKLPSDNSADVPWHQDLGVTWEEADDSEIITCWIPLVDATRERGCMEIIPGVNKIGYLEHTPDGGTRIRPDLMPDIEPVCAECPRGGMIFLSKLIPHRGLPNTSDVVRWSMDLRYQKTGTLTGRPFYPDFPTYSASDESAVLTDHAEWCQRWIDGLEAGKGQVWHRSAKKAAMEKEAKEKAAAAAN